MRKLIIRDAKVGKVYRDMEVDCNLATKFKFIGIFEDYYCFQYISGDKSYFDNIIKFSVNYIVIYFDEFKYGRKWM